MMLRKISCPDADVVFMGGFGAVYPCELKKKRKKKGWTTKKVAVKQLQQLEGNDEV